VVPLKERPRRWNEDGNSRPRNLRLEMLRGYLVYKYQIQRAVERNGIEIDTRIKQRDQRRKKGKKKKKRPLPPWRKPGKAAVMKMMQEVSKS
jgi:hypothetical protein